MAAYTSTKSGNWSDPTVWGGGPPGLGDSATIASPHMVLADSDITDGTSPANQTTADLIINGPAGKLILGAGVTFTMMGNAFVNAGASGNIQSGLVWSAGSSFKFGAHNVSGGWVLKCGQYNTYATVGTSAGSPAALLTDAATTTNACLTSASGTTGNCFNASYLNFTRLGSSTVPAMAMSSRSSAAYGATSASFTGCTFDTCGPISFASHESGTTYTVTGCAFQNSLKNSILAVTFYNPSSNTTPETITNNVFGMNAAASGAQNGVTFSPAGSASVTGNYFGEGLSLASAGSLTTWPVTDSYPGTWSKNLIRSTANGGGYAASLDHTYLLNDGETQNGGILATWQAAGANKTMDSCVVEVTYSQGVNVVGDYIEPVVNTTASVISGTANNGNGLVRVTTSTAHNLSTGDTAHIGCTTGTTEANGIWTVTVIDGTHFDLQGSTYTNAWISGGNVARFNTSLTIQNTILVPGGPARAGAKWVSVLNQAFAPPAPSIAVNHCTWATSNYGTQSEAAIGLGEGGDAHTANYGWAGELTSFKSNIAWSPDATHPGYLTVRQNSTKPDYVLAGNCDYNWGYQLATDAGSSPIYGYYRWSTYQATPFFSSGSPDVHGCVANATYRADPQFVDSTRCMALYSSVKLGITPTRGTWATSTAYSVGDTVSQAVSGYYGGAAINYRCITVHTSASTTKPGSGASWRTNWEFDSLYQLRQGIASNGPVNVLDLVRWTRGGFVPQNPNTWFAAHDGTTVGAVQSAAVPVAVGLKAGVAAAVGVSSPTAVGLKLGTAATVSSTTAGVSVKGAVGLKAGVSAHIAASAQVTVQAGIVPGFASGISGGVLTGPVPLREAVCSRLNSDPILLALVGSRKYFGALPQSAAILSSPALTYRVIDRTRGITLNGADATSRGTIELTAWATSEATADQIIQAARNSWDGYHGTILRCEVMSALVVDERDTPYPPKAGSDQWLYSIALTLDVKHRTPLPTGV